MKTAYILTSYPCLSETFARREIEGLRKAGAEIEVLAADGEERVEGCAYRPRRWSRCAAASVLYMLRVYPLAPVKLLCVVVRFLLSSPREAVTVLGNIHTIAFFCQRLDEKRIAHLHAYFLSWPACIALAVARISGRSFSIGAHSRDIFVESGAAEYKVRNAAFVTVCSQQGLEHLKRMLPPCLHHKLRLVRHWVEGGATPLPLQEGRSKRTRAAAIGRLVSKKGFEYLVRAWGEVVKACRDAELVIVGEGPEEMRLKELIGELGIQDSVRLMGRREHKEAMRLLAESSVLAVPSVVAEDGDRDGIPNVVLEAFARGVPVVASGLAGIGEAVEHNETGLLVRPGDVEELAAAIRLLLKDEQLRGRLVEKAKKTIGERFDAEANVRALAELFGGDQSSNAGSACESPGRTYPAETRRGRDAEEKESKKYETGQKNAHRKEEDGGTGNRIKIAHIVEGFEGGVSTYLCNVLPGLVREGLDVTLICSLKRHCPPAVERIEQLRRWGVKVHIISMHRELNVFKDVVSFFVLLWVMLVGRFDIVHTHCSKAGALGRAAALLTGVPVRLHSAHCFAFVRMGGRFSKRLCRFIERMLAGITTRFIAVSRSEADIAVESRIFGREKTAVIRNGLPPVRSSKATLSRESLGLRDGTRVVVTACRLVEYKGVERFLEAARVCGAEDTVFLVAGDGPVRRQMEAYISEHGLEERVKLLGYVEQIEELYSICDAVVLCSDSEGQPYVLLEAMRAGAAAVATDVAGNRELLEGGCGVLVEANAEAVARGIESVLGDRRRAREFAENGRRRFLANHLLETQTADLVDVYRGCLVDAGEEYAGDGITAG